MRGGGEMSHAAQAAGNFAGAFPECERTRECAGRKTVPVYQKPGQRLRRFTCTVNQTLPGCVSVLVRKHDCHDGFGIISWSADCFEINSLGHVVFVADFDTESDDGATIIGSDGEAHHHQHVPETAFFILAVVIRERNLNALAPRGGCHRHRVAKACFFRHFGNVNQNTVCDGVCSTVGKNDWILVHGSPGSCIRPDSPGRLELPPSRDCFPRWVGLLLPAGGPPSDGNRNPCHADELTKGAKAISKRHDTLSWRDACRVASAGRAFA